MARRRRKFNIERAITFVTALAALLTAAYTYQLVRETRFAMGIGTLQNLEREFNEARMRRARREAAARGHVMSRADLASSSGGVLAADVLPPSASSTAPCRDGV